MISISTNACATDSVRVKHTIPSWLRTFPEVDEVVVVIDEGRPTGRIAALHGQYSNLDALHEELERIRRSDSRVRLVRLAEYEPRAVLSKWFSNAEMFRGLVSDRGLPIKCQAGTPIFAFLQAVEAASGAVVMRTDCDMLFHNNGWLGEAAKRLAAGEADFVEPFRPCPPDEAYFFSTRSFVVSRETLALVLPIRAHTLDPLRMVQRLAAGRSPWLALEQTIEQERLKGRVRAAMLPRSFGFSLHVATHQQASLDWFGRVPPLVEEGWLPPEQRPVGDFYPPAWEAAFAEPAGV